MLAAASDAIVIGFNVDVTPSARSLAEVEGVDIRLYNVIYRLVEDIDKALRGLLEPEFRDVTIGKAEVLTVFHIHRRGNIAGCMVKEGRVERGAFARVWRGDDQVYEGTIASLKRFKDDVREVASGYECGIGLEDFQDIQAGDVIEVYRREQVV